MHSLTSGARGGACRISAFTSEGRKFHHCQNQAAGVFFFSSMHGTQQNQVVCGIFMFFDEFPGSTTFFKEIPEIY